MHRSPQGWKAPVQVKPHAPACEQVGTAWSGVAQSAVVQQAVFARQPPPHGRKSALQLNPHAFEVQVAFAFGGAAHSAAVQQLPSGMHSSPQRL